MTTKLNKQLVIRVDDDLYALMQQDAEDNGRTVAQSVRHLLKQVLKDRAAERD